MFIAVLCVPVRQVEVALARLKDSSLDHDDHLVCLEALARLAWSDDSVRQVRGRVQGLCAVVLLVTAKSSTARSVCCGSQLAHDTHV
jgi:hypothetical protein